MRLPISGLPVGTRALLPVGIATHRRSLAFLAVCSSRRAGVGVADMARLMARREKAVDLEPTDVGAVLAPYDYEGEPADSWLELVASV
jgi:hypothetical protein